MFWGNLKTAMGRAFRAHPTSFIMVALLLIVLRGYAQPAAIFIRQHLFTVVLAVGIVFWLRYWIQRKRLVPILAIAGTVGAIVFVIVRFGFDPHGFHTLFFQHGSLNKVQLEQMPQTRYERTHPLVSVKTMAGAVVADVEHIVDPDYVRYHNEYRWTVGVEPQFVIRRLFGSIKTVFAIPGQAAALDFTGDHQVRVRFTTGESMLFFRDASYLARQKFGPLKFWNYQPEDLKYIPGPDGSLVQVLTLTRWKGILFPRPVFGGVMVFEQDKNSFVASLFETFKRLFVGEGEFISAEDVTKHDWLVGQNIVPYDAARHMGLSFRFHRGYMAPMPFYHFGDVEIPDLPGDMNDQPFTSYFDFDEDVYPDKLYHYFALEPYRKDRQGLALSVLIPADGVGPVLFADHEESRMIGVSPVATLVRDSKKWYDWSNTHVAEQRPYIRDIAGKRRYCYLSTVVTRQVSDADEKDKSQDRVGAISGMHTEITITDALIKRPVWIENLDPSTWEQQIEDNMSKEFGEKW